MINVKGFHFLHPVQRLVYMCKLYNILLFILEYFVNTRGNYVLTNLQKYDKILVALKNYNAKIFFRGFINYG